MRATRVGTCRSCGASIAIGDTIRYSRAAGARHNDCRGMDRRDQMRSTTTAGEPLEWHA